MVRNGSIVLSMLEVTSEFSTDRLVSIFNTERTWTPNVDDYIYFPTE